MAKLKANVWVSPYGTEPVFLSEGTEDSNEHAYLVQNPELWDGDSKAVSPFEEQFRQEARDSAPPRTGKGSTRTKWVEFAAEYGYEADENESKEEIISNLESLEII